MNLVKLTTNPSASIAFSSIAPTELYTKVDDSKTDNAKIVVSWVKSESDNEPVPSESIINKFIYYPFDYTLIGYDHTHSPYFILIFLDVYKYIYKHTLIKCSNPVINRKYFFAIITKY